jgi:hypothetical protein
MLNHARMEREELTWFCTGRVQDLSEYNAHRHQLDQRQ